MIIIEQIELNGMCAKIKMCKYASLGLMRENLAVRKYLRLQYSVFMQTQTVLMHVCGSNARTWYVII